MASVSTLQAFQDSGCITSPNLRYVIVACLGPLVADAASLGGDRAGSIGTLYFYLVSLSVSFGSVWCLSVSFGAV